VIAAFFGLATVAHAQPGSVAVFNNPDYIDNADPGFGAEGPNTIASLQSFGENATAFTDFSAAGFTAALAGKDTLVIPEEENNLDTCLAENMTQDARDVVKNFVGAGGQLVLMATGEDGCKDVFLNDVFGYSVSEGVEVNLATRGVEVVNYNKTAAAAGTEWADGPASVPDNNATGTLDETTLPPTAKSIYSDGAGNSAVAVFAFGDGSVTTLGWDWFESSPPDPVMASGPTSPVRAAQPRGADSGAGQDFRWQDVFRRSVDLPVVSVGDVSVTEGNSGTTPATFAVTASQNHSEVLHVPFGTANGTATAGSDYTAASGSATLDRSTLSTPVGVNVTGDTAIEPNETFSLGLAAGPAPFAAAIGKAGTGTIVNDDFAKPAVGVAGVRRACTSSSTVHVRFTINAAAGLKRVTVTLDGKRVASTTKSRFTITVHTKKLKAGRHTITAVALDNKGQKTTVRKTIARCAAATPKRKAAPRFTG
jgi:hypothetical protein